MTRRREQLLDRGLFDLASGVHHHHPARILGDDPHVVGDQHDRGTELLLELDHQVEDLRLDGDVEGGGGLVGEQDLRTAGKGHPDHHALVHAAGELVGVLVRTPLRLGHAHEPEHVHGALPCIAPGQALVANERLRDLATHRDHRIQRCHRLLEDHRDLASAHLLHLRLGEVQEVVALEAHRAARDAARGLGEKTHDRERGHRLAAPGLAHHAERLPCFDGVGHSMDGAQEPVAGPKLDAQIGDFEQGRHEFNLQRSGVRRAA